MLSLAMVMLVLGWLAYVLVMASGWAVCRLVVVVCRVALALRPRSRIEPVLRDNVVLFRRPE
jgi:hypothetical protein